MGAGREGASGPPVFKPDTLASCGVSHIMLLFKKMVLISLEDHGLAG